MLANNRYLHLYYECGNCLQIFFVEYFLYNIKHLSKLLHMTDTFFKVYLLRFKNVALLLGWPLRGQLPSKTPFLNLRKLSYNICIFVFRLWFIDVYDYFSCFFSNFEVIIYKNIQENLPKLCEDIRSKDTGYNWHIDK